MDGKLQLVTVDSPAAERALLRALSQLSVAAASRVTPARRAEVPKLRALAQRCGREVVVGPLSESEIEAAGLGQAMTEGHIPNTLVVGSTVDPSLQELATVLCRREAVRLDELARGWADLPTGATAMLFWAPDSTPMGTMITALEALAERDIRVGLLPCFGADSDRWAVLKALSFPLLPSRGMRRVMSSSLSRANAPSCLGGLDHQVPSLLREPLDVLAFEGHGNPQDLFVGRNAILCARQGLDSAAIPRSGLLPCYHDGVCFRRAFRLPDAELIPGDALDTLLLFALTCYYVHLGKSPFSQSSGLGPQIMSGATVAVISSPGVVWTYPAMLVLGLCLIHEGRRLADVAHALDRLHRDTFGLSTGLPKSIPSITVFGNPCARLQPLGVADASIIDRDGRTLVAKTPSATPGLGAFLRVRLDDPDKSVGAWSLEGLAKDAWAHGVLLGDEAEERLYLWLGEQAIDSRDTLRLSPFEPCNAERRTLDAFVEALDFWPLFFDYCLEVRESRKANVEPLEQALKVLPRWQRRFTQLAMAAAPPHVAVLVDGNAGSRRVFDRALARMREFSTTVLDLCANILARDGFNDIGVYGPLLNGASDLTSGPCACGQCELQTHQWVPLSGARPDAYRHACPCASAGYDSCRYNIAWKSSPPTARLSKSLCLSLALTAPNDHYLMVKATAVLLRPSHDRRISGPVVELLLAPGEQGELPCELCVPSDLPLGLHEISVIAILNGAFMQRCYMIDLRAAE